MPDKQVDAVNRYLTLFDRYLDGKAQLDELRTIFAPDAYVNIRPGEERTGIDVLLPYYEGILANLVETRHVWTITRVDDTTLETDWAAGAKLKNGAVMGIGGFERARFNQDGLMVHLVNYPNRAAAG